MISQRATQLDPAVAARHRSACAGQFDQRGGIGQKLSQTTELCTRLRERRVCQRAALPERRRAARRIPGVGGNARH